MARALAETLGSILVPDWALGGWGTIERPRPVDKVVEIEIDMTAWERYLPEVPEPNLEGEAS